MPPLHGFSHGIPVGFQYEAWRSGSCCPIPCECSGPPHPPPNPGPAWAFLQYAGQISDGHHGPHPPKATYYAHGEYLLLPANPPPYRSTWDIPQLRPWHQDFSPLPHELHQLTRLRLFPRLPQSPEQYTLAVPLPILCHQ